MSDHVDTSKFGQREVTRMKNVQELHTDAPGQFDAMSEKEVPVTETVVEPWIQPHEAQQLKTKWHVYSSATRLPRGIYPGIGPKIMDKGTVMTCVYEGRRFFLPIDLFAGLGLVADDIKLLDQEVTTEPVADVAAPAATTPAPEKAKRGRPKKNA